MEKCALVLLAAAAFLILSVANADGKANWSKEQVLRVYIPGPSTIIAGPGAATNNISETGFGSLGVYDVEMKEGLEDTSKSLGQCRGFFLVDSYDGTNILMFFTLDFTSELYNGSVVVAGTQNLLNKQSTVPITGGNGDFAFAKGYVTLKPILPESSSASDETLVATYYTEVHYMLPKSLSDIEM